MRGTHPVGAGERGAGVRTIAGAPGARGQVLAEYLLLTACIAIVMLLPFGGDPAPGAMLARAVARFGRAFVLVVSGS